MNAQTLWLTESSLYKNLQNILHPYDFECLKEILNQSEFDLYPDYGGFTESDFSEIHKKALEIFLNKVKNSPPQLIDHEQLRFLWKETVHDFLRNYWGYKKNESHELLYKPQILDLPLLPASAIPKKISPPTSKKELFFYIWAVLQSFIFVKALMLVYGNELAKEDTTKNRIIFGILMLFSFGSLFYFAFSRHKKLNKK